ncbi:hypothetical protein Tco_0568551 [Tanacetum coccineum]
MDRVVIEPLRTRLPISGRSYSRRTMEISNYGSIAQAPPRGTGGRILIPENCRQTQFRAEAWVRNFLDKLPRDCLKSSRASQGSSKHEPKAVVAQGTEDVQPPVVQIQSRNPVLEPIVAPVVAPVPNTKPSVSLPYPSRRDNEKSPDFVVVDFEPDPRVPLILGRCFLKTGRALIDVHKGELTLRIGSEAITSIWIKLHRYSAQLHSMTANKIDVIDLACEEYSQEVLGKNPLSVKVLSTTSEDSLGNFSDILGITPEFRYTQILMGREDYAPAGSNIRRRKSKIHECYKKEVEKLLEAGLFTLSPKDGEYALTIDFSKISRPMTHLLEKNTPFIFSDDCIRAFQNIEDRLRDAPILDCSKLGDVLHGNEALEILSLCTQWTHRGNMELLTVYPPPYHHKQVGKWTKYQISRFEKESEKGPIGVDIIQKRQINQAKMTNEAWNGKDCANQGQVQNVKVRVNTKNQPVQTVRN